MLPAMFNVWCDILRRSPHSVLLLLGVDPEGSTAQRIEREARPAQKLLSRLGLC